MSFSAKLSGWGAYLSDVYQRRCDVYNRGMSGYNTDWFLRYLETKEGYQDVFGSMKSGGSYSSSSSSSNVKLVTIFFGANDASCKELNPRHHVPLSRFEPNLKKIVDKCKDSFGNDAKFVFITPPPVCHKSRLEYQIQLYKEKASGELERNLNLSGQYAAVVERVAKELGVPCLNIWKDMQEKSHDEAKNSVDDEKHPWSIYLSDGLHLSREGNLFVGEKLNDLIAKEYPDIAVTHGPWSDYTGNSASRGGLALGSDGGIGPWHDEIDHLHAEKAFVDANELMPKRQRFC